MMEAFLPSMRALVSKKLQKQGFSQGRIASLLEITQASVSLYLSGRTSRPLQLLSSLGISSEEAERFSSLLAEDLKENPVYAVSTLYSIWSDLLGRGLMCHPHRKDYPFLAECDICMRTFGSRQARGSDAIDYVSRAVSMLESSGTFVRVMPQVSVNITYACGEAASVQDVVAIPGRIVKVRDRAKSFTKPEFGASAHLAKILLQVRTRMKDVRAAINMKYDRNVEKVLRKLRLRALKIGGIYTKEVDDSVVDALRQKMRETDEQFDALIDLGGSGFEPSLYLFAKDPMEVAQTAIKMSRMYPEARKEQRLSPSFHNSLLNLDTRVSKT
jgi:predicted fused transcriptional regulator/phosphomethylpyrimidine kinase/predicted transcriptional regulator